MDNKQYIIVHEDGVIALENEVNRKLDEGYVPYGNMVVSSNGDRHNNSSMFCQPMMLKEKEKETYGKC